MNKIKRHPYLLISSIISLVMGLMLLFSDYTRIINFIYFIVGGGLIVTGISKILMENYSRDKTYVYDGIVNILVGVMIMFVHNIIVTIILGAIFIVFPLLRIFRSTDKKSSFKRELPLLIIGLVIALSGDLIAEVFIKFLGALFILFAIYLFINIFTGKISFIKFSYHSTQEEKSQSDVIDVDFEESESDE